jgi:hypothetical protein
MSQAKFHTHTKPQEELWCCIFLFLQPLTADEETEGSGLNGSKQ